MEPTHVAPVVVTRYGRPTSNLPIIYPVIDSDGAIAWGLYLYWHVELTHWSFIVPEGSVTNFASIPWWLRWLLSPVDPVVVIPAIAHDYLVAEMDFIITNNATGQVSKRSDVTIPWHESARLFLAYRKNYSRWWPRCKLVIVYLAICIYGIVKHEK